MGRTIAEEVGLKPETVDDLLASGWLYMNLYGGGLAFCNREFHDAHRKFASAYTEANKETESR
jgi:hypothetical protein